jgi:predicted transcriptional regulator
LTDREAEIKPILWKHGAATAEDIRQQLSGQPHDSTVRTLLRILMAKGYVTASSKARPTLYRPAIKQRSVQKKAAKEFLQRFFGGSAEELVLHLLDDERLSPEQLKHLESTYRRRADEEQKNG